MTRGHLDTFVRAIGGDATAAGTIVAGYADLLARRLGPLAATLPAAERDLVLEAVADTDQSPGGVLAALMAPPVAAQLLARRTVAGSAARLADEMRRAAGTAFDAVPPTVTDASWLTEQGDGARWQPVNGPDVTPGWDLLRERAPNQFETARVSTRAVIHAVPADSRGSVPGSWSTDELIGCTVLVNARQEPAWLAESLLHEAVHHLQGMVEARTPFIQDPALVRSADRFASPWTGAPLTAKSLLAACFVWYALLIFATGAGLTGLAERAASGFIDGDPAALVGQYAAALDPDVVATVEDVQETARHTIPA